MKIKTRYVCNSCGSVSPKWLGKCYNCGEWDSFIEEKEPSKNTTKSSYISTNTVPHILSDIDFTLEKRLNTGILEIDRVLGNGFVPGSLVLIGGDPGIGKSTLLLQICSKLKELRPLYISGEESSTQIGYRASRLNVEKDSIYLLTETNFDSIIDSINNFDSKFIVIDSIQAVFTEQLESSPGSVAQIRECTNKLMNIAKKTGKTIVIIGHINKEGAIAGPKVLEHMVDCVLQFEGDKTNNFRILRALKNRYGSTNELGLFEMNINGLEEVKNPSKVLLNGSQRLDSGVCITATVEGTRPLLIEVQALVTYTGFSVPQRTSNGFDPRRLSMILAVLEKKLGERFSKQDVFLNIAGGIYMNDPASDLAIAASLVSSLKDKSIDAKTVFIGEIGLTGEVRPVTHLEQRINEAAKLGFTNFFIPKQNISSEFVNLVINKVERISVTLASIFD